MVLAVECVMRIMKELPTIINFLPCKSCSNILTDVCFDDCMRRGEFEHYKQRPGTDILELPPFPAEEVLNYPNPRFRMLALVVYLAAITDYLQHMEEYERNREYY